MVDFTGQGNAYQLPPEVLQYLQAHGGAGAAMTPGLMGGPAPMAPPPAGGAPPGPRPGGGMPPVPTPLAPAVSASLPGPAVSPATAALVSGGAAAAAAGPSLGRSLGAGLASGLNAFVAVKNEEQDRKLQQADADAYQQWLNDPKLPLLLSPNNIDQGKAMVSVLRGQPPAQGRAALLKLGLTAPEAYMNDHGDIAMTKGPNAGTLIRASAPTPEERAADDLYKTAPAAIQFLGTRGYNTQSLTAKDAVAEAARLQKQDHSLPTNEAEYVAQLVKADPAKRAEMVAGWNAVHPHQPNQPLAPHYVTQPDGTVVRVDPYTGNAKPVVDGKGVPVQARAASDNSILGQILGPNGAGAAAAGAVPTGTTAPAPSPRSEGVSGHKSGEVWTGKDGFQHRNNNGTEQIKPQT